LKPEVPAQEPSFEGVPDFWLAGAVDTASLVADGAADVSVVQPNLTLLNSQAELEEKPDQRMPLIALVLAVLGKELRGSVIVCVEPVRPVTGTMADLKSEAEHDVLLWSSTFMEPPLGPLTVNWIDL
jgi:hypothetical protein